MGECSRLCVSARPKRHRQKRSIKVYAIRFNRARAIEARNFENCGFYFISVFHLNFSSHSHSLSFSRLFVLFNYSSRGKLYLAESFVWYIYEAAATTMASAVAEYGVWWFDQRRHEALAMNSSWEIDCSYNFFCFVLWFFRRLFSQLHIERKLKWFWYFWLKFDGCSLWIRECGWGHTPIFQHFRFGSIFQLRQISQPTVLCS